MQVANPSKPIQAQGPLYLEHANESLQPTLTTSVEQRLSGSTQSHTFGWRSHASYAGQITLTVLLPRQIAFSASWEGPCVVAVRKRKRERMSPWYVHILSIANLYGIHTWRRIVINLKRYRNGLHVGHTAGRTATHTPGQIHMKRHANTSNLEY